MTTHDTDLDSYVDLVRLYLGDLDDATRDELTDGLVTDLADLVADRGRDALPDPEEYADELRAAAGLTARRPHLPAPTTHSGVPSASARVGEVLDAARERAWVAVDSRAVRAVAPYAEDLRPVWWLARGQAAFWLWQTATAEQNGLTLLPWNNAPGVYTSNGASPVIDTVVWLTMLLVSLRLGRSARRGLPPTARLALLATNTGAALAMFYLLDRLENIYYWLW